MLPYRTAAAEERRLSQHKFLEKVGSNSGGEGRGKGGKKPRNYNFVSASDKPLRHNEFAVDL